MTAPAASVDRGWREAGRRAAAALDVVSAVVVLGDDPVVAASVALGMGAYQSRRRRVAIGDLVGEVPPIQSLVTGDDPHGLVDSFLYGVSLNKIARPADSSGNLFVLPSGTEPIVAEEIFRNERWARLATGFRDVGALLVLVAPVDAPGVDALARQLDGVVLAGPVAHLPEGVPVVAAIALPAPQASAAPAPTAAPVRRADEPRVERPSAPASVSPSVPPSAPRAAAPAPAPLEAAVDVRAVPAADAAAAAPVPRAPEREAAIAPPQTAETESAEGASAEGTPPTDAPAARWVRRVVVEAPPTLVGVPTVAAPAVASAPHDEVSPREVARRLAPRPHVAPAPRAWVPPRTARPRWLVPVAAGVVAVVGVAALLARTGGTRSESGRRTAQSSASAESTTVVSSSAGTTAADSAVADSAGVPAAADSATAPAPPSVVTAFPITNPADSAEAAAYAVQIVAANTVAGARAKMRDVAGGLPATVISPMAFGPDSSTRWYRLTVGAFVDRKTATAFLVDVRTRRKLDLDVENIVRLPFALVLESGLPRGRAKTRAAVLSARGLPAYALVQRDGTGKVYAGAFETPEQAGLLAKQLRDAGIAPVVAYRTGKGY